MDSIAIWLTTTPGIVTALAVTILILLFGGILLLLSDRRTVQVSAFFLVVLSAVSISLPDIIAKHTNAPEALLSSIGPCERQKLVAATSPQSPITIGDVRKAERHCEELAEQAPQREADSRTRAEQNAVLSASADPS